MACLFGHKWNGCKCKSCGKTRDEQHDWNGYMCSRCGEKRDIKEICDQSVLSDIAKNLSLSIDERCKAVNNLTDQSALAEIAKLAIYKGLSHDKNIKIRLAAVERIINSSLLADIALSAEYFYQEDNVGKIAIGRISDQNVLISIANDTRYHLQAREIAVANIKDQNILLKLPNYAVRKEIKKNNCENGNHKWEYLKNCQKKCKVCGVVWYDHELKCTFSPVGDNALPSEYMCRKCGYKGLDGGQGGATLQTGLVK